MGSAAAHLRDVAHGAGGPDCSALVALAHGGRAPAAALRVGLLAQLAPQPGAVVAGGVVPERLQEQRAQLGHAEPEQIPARMGSTFLSNCVVSAVSNSQVVLWGRPLPVSQETLQQASGPS